MAKKVKLPKAVVLDVTDPVSPEIVTWETSVREADTVAATNDNFVAVDGLHVRPKKEPKTK